MTKMLLPLAVCLVLIAFTAIARDWGMTLVLTVVLMVGVLISMRKSRGDAARVQAIETSWEKSSRRAMSEANLPVDVTGEGDFWSQPRVGLIRRGSLARRYMWVIRENEDQWSYLLSEADEASKKVDYVLIESRSLAQEVFRSWKVVWLPVGHYADSVWLHRLSGRIKSRRVQGD